MLLEQAHRFAAVGRGDRGDRFHPVSGALELPLLQERDARVVLHDEHGRRRRRRTGRRRHRRPRRRAAARFRDSASQGSLNLNFLRDLHHLQEQAQPLDGLDERLVYSTGLVMYTLQPSL